MTFIDYIDFSALTIAIACKVIGNFAHKRSLKPAWDT